mgnify:CR=1 FL=1
MKKITIAIVCLMMVGTALQAQKYFTRDGKVAFFSSTPIENIEAHNSKATSVLDTESGRMEFAILIKAFQFEKALMQEHFNENYMESSTYPKATFKGAVRDWSEVDLTKDGEYPVTVAGDMTIHGVTQKVEAPGVIIVSGGDLSATSEFPVTVADYDIEIPAVVRENIAKEVKVSVAIDYQPLSR